MLFLTNQRRKSSCLLDLNRQIEIWFNWFSLNNKNGYETKFVKYH